LSREDGASTHFLCSPFTKHRNDVWHKANFLVSPTTKSGMSLSVIRAQRCLGLDSGIVSMFHSWTCQPGGSTYLDSISMLFETWNLNITDYRFFKELAFWQSKLTAPNLKRTSSSKYNRPSSR
jgi:hypothetical protein